MCGMDLANGDVHLRIGDAGAETVALPEKMLKFGAAVDSVFAEQKRRGGHLAAS